MANELMKWTNLLSTRRPKDLFGSKKDPETATEQDFLSGFEKDLYTIIGNSYFRRLQDKTQVYTLDDSDFVRTRLTHSIEVATICEILGSKVAPVIREKNATLEHPEELPVDLEHSIPMVLRCAGLLHDIGNPPFGHTVEDFISKWFSPTYRSEHGLAPLELSQSGLDDLTHFDGNVQNQRIVLHFGQDSNPDKENENYGMNLTSAVIGAILKYPYSAKYAVEHETNKRKKIGYFHVDQWIVERVQKELGTLPMNATPDTKGKRNPLMLLLEAADDIAYGTADLEDSVKKGVLSMEDVLLFFPEEIRAEMIGQTDFKDLQQRLKKARELSIDEVIKEFSEHYQEIMVGDYDKGLVSCCSHNFKDKKDVNPDAKKLNSILVNIYIQRDVDAAKLHHTENYINDILTALVDAVLDADTEKDTSKSALLRKELGQYYDKAIKEFERCDTYFVEHPKSPEHYAAGSIEQKQNLNYFKLLGVIDFVSGMTDGYVELFAKRLYDEKYWEDEANRSELRRIMDENPELAKYAKYVK